MSYQVVKGNAPRFAAFVGATMLVAMLGMANVAQAQGGYFGGSIGQSDYDGFSDNPTGVKIFGGYNLNKNFGVEATWYDFGEAKDSGVTVEVDGIGFTANGYLPLSNEFALFGKIGLLMWDADTNVGVSDDGTDIVYGFGGKWDLNRQFALRVEYEKADIDDGDATFLSVGFSYHF